MSDDFGERIGDDALRFKRSFAAPIERVWSAISEPESLAVWLGRATVEPGPGGRFEIYFDDENCMDGHIVAFEPPRLLVLAWREFAAGVPSQHATRARDESLVRFELTPDAGGGTKLVFTHTYIRAGHHMLGFGAGWHAHLTALAACVARLPAPDREALYERLRAPYQARLSV